MRAVVCVLLALLMSAVFTAPVGATQPVGVSEPEVFSLPPEVHDPSLTPDQLQSMQQLGVDVMGRNNEATRPATRQRNVSDLSIVPLYEANVPAEVRTVVDQVLVDYADAIAFNPAGPVELAIAWQSIPAAGFGGSNYIRVRGQGVYPATLADTLFGGDHTPNEADGFLVLNSDQSDSWYYGLDHGAIPQSQHDLYSVAAHEVTHALGFASGVAVYPDGTFRLASFTNQFSQHLVHNGQRLVDMNVSAQSAAIVSDNVTFDMGGGLHIPMYAPPEGWAGALAHTAEQPFERSHIPGVLMAPAIVNGASHPIDGAILGILSRLGWPMRGGVAAPVNLGASSDGASTTVSFSTDLLAPIAPAHHYRIDIIQNRSITSTVVVPAIQTQAVFPLAVGNDDAVVFTPLDGADRAWIPSTYSPGGRTISSAGSVSEIAAAADFVPEHADVLRLYFAFFDRDPDADGARYWIRNVYSTGSGLDVIAANFAASEEFALRYGEPDNRQFLSIVYANVLGREFDQTGFDYWLGLLERGELSRGGVVRWVATGDEFKLAHPY